MSLNLLAYNFLINIFLGFSEFTGLSIEVLIYIFFCIAAWAFLDIFTGGSLASPYKFIYLKENLYFSKVPKILPTPIDIVIIVIMSGLIFVIMTLPKVSGIKELVRDIEGYSIRAPANWSIRNNDSPILLSSILKPQYQNNVLISDSESNTFIMIGELSQGYGTTSEFKKRSDLLINPQFKEIFSREDKMSAYPQSQIISYFNSKGKQYLVFAQGNELVMAHYLDTLKISE